jgi:hypothetical protein
MMRAVDKTDLELCKPILCNHMAKKINYNPLIEDFNIVSHYEKGHLYSLYESPYLPYGEYFENFNDFLRYYHTECELLTEILSDERIKNKNNLLQYNSDMRIVKGI